MDVKIILQLMRSVLLKTHYSFQKIGKFLNNDKEVLQGKYLASFMLCSATSL